MKLTGLVESDEHGPGKNEESDLGRRKLRELVSMDLTRSLSRGQTACVVVNNHVSQEWTDEKN